MGKATKSRARSTGAGAAAPAHSRIASEEELGVVEALRQGDEEAFARLVDQHHASLHRIARLYVSDASIADEVVQDTWLGVIQGVWAFEGRSSLRTWILRILVNRAKTRALRESRTTPFADLGLLDLEAPEAALDRARREPSPEVQLLAQETLEHIRKAIDALPANQRIVLT